MMKQDISILRAAMYHKHRRPQQTSMSSVEKLKVRMSLLKTLKPFWALQPEPLSSCQILCMVLQGMQAMLQDGGRRARSLTSIAATQLAAAKM